MQYDDTIVAFSSPPAPCARIILRLSGPAAGDYAGRLCPPLRDAEPGVSRRRLTFQDLTVPATVYTFCAPRSYTGQDLVELHIPGNPVLAKMLLQTLLEFGARPADPGEFTARAYFNGRLDLTEAEGVAALVSANTEAELRAGRQLLAGELSRRLRPIMDSLAQALALVEVGIDFSDEDVTFLPHAELVKTVREADTAIGDLIHQSARFERLAHEPRAVLVGRPNAGKSTLLNALAGTTRAVVSPTPGTTRDALSAEISLPRGLIHLTDVAGIESSASTSSHIDTQMQSRALAALESADLVLLVHDLTDSRPLLELPRRHDLLILTKLDLRPNFDAQSATPSIAVSADAGAHLDTLRKTLDDLAFGSAAESPALALNTRHLMALENARAPLKHLLTLPASTTPDLLALDLRESLDHLGQILGTLTPDDILTRVFSTFCIGK
jgi:tRNA modification GTPase